MIGTLQIGPIISILWYYFYHKTTGIIEIKVTMATLNLPKIELNLKDNQINSLVQQYVTQCYSKSNIADRIYSYATQRISKKIDQMINDGTLLDAIAKRVIKDMSIEQLISLVDKDKLNEVVVERVSKCLINRMKL